MTRYWFLAAVLVVGCSESDDPSGNGGTDMSGGNSGPVDTGSRDMAGGPADSGMGATDMGGGGDFYVPVEPTNERGPGRVNGCCAHRVGLAVGSDGEARMVGSRRRSGRTSLWFGTRSGGMWTDEEVSEAPSISPPGELTAMALGPDDSPHILYIDSVGPNFVLHYARRAGDSWEGSPVADDALIGNGFADFDIAVGGDGTVHVVFFDEGTLSARYARWNGTAFDVSEIEAPADGDQLGEFARIALADDGTLHVSYLAQVSGTPVLRHAEGPAPWTVEDVPGMGKGVHGTILVDESVVHIVSTDLRSMRARGIYWSRREGTSWTETEIDPEAAIVEMDAALDPMGRVHVAPSVSFGAAGRFFYYYPTASGSYDNFRSSAPPGDAPESVAIIMNAMGIPRIAVPNGFLVFE